MMQSDTERQRQLQVLIAHLVAAQVGHLALVHAQPLLRVHVARQKRDQVERGHARLTSRRDKDEHGLVGRVDLYLLEAGLVHGGHARTVEFAREALDVHLERNGPHRGLEVEEAALTDAQPVGEIARVRQRRREANDAHRLVRVRRDEVGARDDYFEDRAAVLTEQVDLVDDDESHVFDVVARLPATRYTVFNKKNQLF